MPRAAAGSAIIRASWPPPTTATVGAAGSPGLTRRSVVARGTGSDRGRLGRAHGVGVAGRLGLEPEPVTAHGGDQVGLAGVVAELAADPSEVHVDGLRRGPEGGVPDRVHQLVTGHDSAGPLHEKMQQVELLAREDDLAFISPHPAGSRVHGDVLDLEHALKIGTGGPFPPGNGSTRPRGTVKSGRSERLCDRVHRRATPRRRCAPARSVTPYGDRLDEPEPPHPAWPQGPGLELLLREEPGRALVDDDPVAPSYRGQPGRHV